MTPTGSEARTALGGQLHDVVVVGAGVDGLVCATLLARGGRQVTLVDRNDHPGGTAASDEFLPGYHASATFPGVETLDPGLVDELDLPRHGLEIFPPGDFALARSEAEPLRLPAQSDGGIAAAAAAVEAQCGPDDARALTAFDGFLRRLAGAFHGVLANPLPALEPGGLGDLLDLARPALRLRRLGAEDLAEFMRYLPMPIHDVVEERFTDPGLRAALAGPALLGTWLGPRSPGGALNLLLNRCGHTQGAVAFPRLVRGGLGSLSKALMTAAGAAGVTFHGGKRVQRIHIALGAAQSVELAGGDHLRARTIVSAIDPRQTLVDLLEPLSLAPEALWQARNIRCRGTVALVHFALDGPPPFHGLDPLPQRIQVGATLDDLERSFDDTKYGRLGERFHLDLSLPTVADSTLAPEGHHVVSAWVQFPPFALRDSSWSEAREMLGDRVAAQIETVAPGFGQRVVGRAILTPADLAERFGLSGGCLPQVEPALDQATYLRPMPGLGRHDTPVRQLWLASRGTHGGGALTGLAGRNAARRVLASKD